MLQGIGFEWQVINQNWIERYKELVAFKATHGNCRVPIVYKDNKPLGKWVGHQREYLQRISRKRTHDNNNDDNHDDKQVKVKPPTNKKARSAAVLCQYTCAAKSIQHQQLQPQSTSYNARLEKQWLDRYHRLVEFKRDNIRVLPTNH
jgi:hypothetical protein